MPSSVELPTQKARKIWKGATPLHPDVVSSSLESSLGQLSIKFTKSLEPVAKFFPRSAMRGDATTFLTSDARVSVYLDSPQCQYYPTCPLMERCAFEEGITIVDIEYANEEKMKTIVHTLIDALPEKPWRFPRSLEDRLGAIAIANYEMNVRKVWGRWEAY